MKKMLAIMVMMLLGTVSTVGCTSTTNQRAQEITATETTMTTWSAWTEPAVTTDTTATNEEPVEIDKEVFNGSVNVPFGDAIVKGKENALATLRELYSNNLQDTGNDFGIYGVQMFIYPEENMENASWITEISGLSTDRYQICILQDFDQSAVKAETIDSSNSKAVSNEQPSSIWAFDRYENTVTVLEVNWDNPVWSGYVGENR